MVTPTGRLMPGTSNEEWQVMFDRLKQTILPSNKAKMSAFENRKLVHHSMNGYGVKYQGPTQYETYCKYINGVLSTIRSGDIDFCYYVYQVEDLLRFEPQHLFSYYMKNNNCFLVFLDSSKNQKAMNLIHGGADETKILSQIHF